jgi:hypothetical protein
MMTILGTIILLGVMALVLIDPSGVKTDRFFERLILEFERTFRNRS